MVWIIVANVVYSLPLVRIWWTCSFSFSFEFLPSWSSVLISNQVFDWINLNDPMNVVCRRYIMHTSYLDTMSVQDVWQHSLCVPPIRIYEYRLQNSQFRFRTVSRTPYSSVVSPDGDVLSVICATRMYRNLYDYHRELFRYTSCRLSPQRYIDWYAIILLFWRHRRTHNFRLSHTDTHFTTNHHLDARTVASDRPDWFVTLQVLFTLWSMTRSPRDPPVMPVEGSYVDRKIFEPHNKIPGRESQEEIASNYSASKVS